MRKSFIGVLIAPLLFITVSFGQAKEITSQDYFDAYATVLHTVLEKPRKRTQTTEYSTNGRVTKTVKEVEEFQNKDTRRSLYTEKVGLRQTRDEVIETGGTYYCRSNGGPWKKSKTGCSKGGARFAAGDSDGEEYFSTEQVTLNSNPLTLLRQYTIYKPSDNIGPTAKRIWENLVWIDRNYRIVRREYKSGIPDGTYTSLVETYDYETKISITPPIR
jgi:hypothetical protein